MKSAQLKVFTLGRWVDLGAPRQYHEAKALADAYKAAGVLAAVSQ